MANQSEDIMIVDAAFAVHQKQGLSLDFYTIFIKGAPYGLAILLMAEWPGMVRIMSQDYRFDDSIIKPKEREIYQKWLNKFNYLATEKLGMNDNDASVLAETNAEYLLDISYPVTIEMMVDAKRIPDLIDRLFNFSCSIIPNNTHDEFWRCLLESACRIARLLCYKFGVVISEERKNSYGTIDLGLRLFDYGSLTLENTLQINQNYGSYQSISLVEFVTAMRFNGEAGIKQAIYCLAASQGSVYVYETPPIIKSIPGLDAMKSEWLADIGLLGKNHFSRSILFHYVERGTLSDFIRKCELIARDRCQVSQSLLASTCFYLQEYSRFARGGSGYKPEFAVRSVKGFMEKIAALDRQIRPNGCCGCVDECRYCEHK